MKLNDGRTLNECKSRDRWCTRRSTKIGKPGASERAIPRKQWRKEQQRQQPVYLERCKHLLESRRITVARRLHCALEQAPSLWTRASALRIRIIISSLHWGFCESNVQRERSLWFSLLQNQANSGNMENSRRTNASNTSSSHCSSTYTCFLTLTTESVV
jgi:hypothetical protein